MYMNIGELFVGGLSGGGVVFSWNGKVLRSFAVEYFGQWSSDEDVLHLDEAVRYADGRLVQRHWAIAFDEAGRGLGYEGDRRSRVRARGLKDRVRMVYDRPLGAGAEIAAPRVVFELFEAPGGGVEMQGKVALLGFVLQRTEATLKRI
jgi:hypothetical protein